MQWKPNVTVAAVISKDSRYLLVEEYSDNCLVINQPAGHLEEGESLVQAVQREVLEETAWHFTPQAATGLYLYPSPENEITYLRICFHGQCHGHRPQQALDTGIVRTLWLTREEIAAQPERMRSPMVLQCIDDYLRGHTFPLDLLSYHHTVDGKLSK